MANVKVIAANGAAEGVLRVAAYCRVSSNSEDQLNSYAAQIRAYTERINSTEGWQLVDIYADEGLTGTKSDKREEFKRLMQDCRAGKIDKVLVKSVSRFARNTYDCLAALRELKLLGISVCFEKENMDTETLTDELAVSVFGSLAQQESVSISQNQLWSYKKRMESGAFITCARPYGYRITNGKELEIIEEEAAVVRRIFSAYLDGMGSIPIAEELNRHGLRTSYGKRWRENTVRYILTNEKYVGDALSQKSFTTDAFPAKSLRNHGQRPKFYSENTHPAIISRQDFEHVQQLIASRRREDYAAREYPMSRLITCAECGGKFMRRSSKTGFITWVCRNHNCSKENCSQMPIAEAELYAAFLRMYNTLKAHCGEILRPAVLQLMALRDAAGRGDPAMAEMTTELAKLMEQEHVVTQLHARSLLDADSYIEKRNALDNRIAELRRKRRELLSHEDDDTIEQAKLLMRIIEDGPDTLEHMDEALFSDIVVRMIAQTDGNLVFELAGGFQFNERVWRENR